MLRLFFHYLEKVVYHLVLVTKLNRKVRLRHRLVVGYLVAWMVQGPVLVEPYPNLSVKVYSDQLSVYVKWHKLLIQSTKCKRSSIKNLKAFGKAELREIAEPILDSF